MHSLLAVCHYPKLGPIVIHGLVLVLILMSIYSWAIIICKYKTLRANSHDLRALINQIEQGVTTKRTSLTIEGITNQPYLNMVKYLQSMSNVLLQGQDTEFIINRAYALLHPLNKALESRVGTLATIGSTAPFIGLLGTVLGVIDSFQSIGRMSAAGFAVVAPGISEALFATAVGLFVAIPAVYAYNTYQNKLHQVFDKQDALIQNLLFYLKFSGLKA